MRQLQITLQLAELDAYHGKLLPTMLDMLRPRLAKAWRTVHEGQADAVLVDLDSREGRRIASDRVDAGLGARTIALGSEGAAPLARMLRKPLRLHALLETLCEIEAEADAPATAEAASARSAAQPRYRMPSWPELGALGDKPDRVRILALLERCPLNADEVARRLDLHADSVRSEIASLLDSGVLVIEGGAPARAAWQPVQRPSAASLGLVAMLRQRFGL